MYYFCIAVLAVFAVIGVTQVCRGIVQAVSRSRDESEIILIEPIRKNQEDAEFTLRSAARKVMWMGRFAPDRVICLDCNMDSETKKLCSLVCSEYPFMQLCSKEEVHSRIDNLL
ncbi:MAG: hypothetical protein II698_06330 [Ruminococcus sp.]|nr:hypothetical protein [Ruminococcus sp.]